MVNYAAPDRVFGDCLDGWSLDPSKASNALQRLCKFIIVSNYTKQRKGDYNDISFLIFGLICTILFFFSSYPEL